MVKPRCYPKKKKKYQNYNIGEIPKSEKRGQRSHGANSQMYQGSTLPGWEFWKRGTASKIGKGTNRA